MKIRNIFLGLFISLALMCYNDMCVDVLFAWLDNIGMHANGLELMALNAVAFGALLMVLEIVKCAASSRVFLPLNFIFLFFALAVPFLRLTSPDFMLFGLVLVKYPVNLIFISAYLLPLVFYLFAWYIVENRREFIKKTQAALFFVFVFLNVLFYAHYLYEVSISFAPNAPCGATPHQTAETNGELNN